MSLHLTMWAVCEWHCNFSCGQSHHISTPWSTGCEWYCDDFPQAMQHQHNIPWPAGCEYKHCNFFCSWHFIASCPMTNRLLWCCVVGCLIISNQASGLGWSKWQVYRHILLLDKFVISWSWPTGCEQHILFLLGIITSSYDLTNSLWVIK